MRFALVLSLLIAVVAVLFALYNPDPVSFNLIQYTVTAPLALVVIVVLLAGVLVGILASLPGTVRRTARIRELEKRVAELERAQPAVVERIVERPAATSAAAETERLAAETERRAAEARARAAEAERRNDPPPPA